MGFKNLLGNIKILSLVTGRNEVVAKVMFLQVSVCPQGGREGVCLSAWWDTRSPPAPGTPPRPGTPPGPGRSPPGSRLQHTVYERPVRILLECILVFIAITHLHRLFLCWHLQLSVIIHFRLAGINGNNDL